ncbi:upstream transcription factor 1, like isoform X1 [Danio rerio]|uniref:Upstream stimulatory factor 1 n=2 Tax=Danio rerio TaxID=7955 RepID=Q6P015_DANRE|nr:upstream transcription factor 1, like [Danio rerio]XP_005171885.1 upstream transcription factor 1, like isoform X1 [Danio rerio]AAH65876.1 Upstream transcription factor 2, c-fos interacting [Danio rerio]|eukprot:NP_998359.1 upstream transcription factor 1, like [Danio rerio]
MTKRKGSDPEDSPILQDGVADTTDDSLAVTAIQSAAAFSTDQQIKYHFLKAEATGGQVTYRVIHLADGQVEGHADGAAAVSVVTGFPTATQAATPPTVMSESVEGETSETQYYYPATLSDTTAGAMVTGLQTADSVLSQPTSAGQLYVMMSPQDVLATTQPSKPGSQRVSRDDKRRAQHNEVERRRRDKINQWIVQLSKTIPDCTYDAKNNQSKSGILSKACDYIQELRQSNARLEDELNTADRLRMDNQLLRKEMEEWKSKNQMIRNQLRQHGIAAASMDSQ